MSREYPGALLASGSLRVHPRGYNIMALTALLLLTLLVGTIYHNIPLTLDINSMV